MPIGVWLWPVVPPTLSASSELHGGTDVHRSQALASALTVLILVGACGGSATQAPAASPSAAASPAPAASVAPDASAETTASEEASEAPSVAPAQSQGSGATGDLAATLPSTVNGVTFEKASIPGGIFPAGIPIGTGEDDFTKFLADNGKSLSDVNIATATAAGSSSVGSVVMAIQVKGVASDKLLAMFMTNAGDMPQANVGGKQVFGAALPGLGGTYLYVHGDTIYYVLSMGSDATMAEGILKQLP